MSVNKYAPHIHVLPEDDADRELANGFVLRIPFRQQSQIKILKPAGGWTEVVEQFNTIHAVEMNRCAQRFMVLLVDFDRWPNRFQQIRETIDPILRDRVFILGAWSDPEDLKKALTGTLESIGAELARDCEDGTDERWKHALLRHNAPEIERFQKSARSILFPDLLPPHPQD